MIIILFVYGGISSSRRWFGYAHGGCRREQWQIIWLFFPYALGYRLVYCRIARLTTLGQSSRRLAGLSRHGSISPTGAGVRKRARPWGGWRVGLRTVCVWGRHHRHTLVIFGIYRYHGFPPSQHWVEITIASVRQAGDFVREMMVWVWPRPGISEGILALMVITSHGVAGKTLLGWR